MGWSWDSNLESPIPKAHILPNAGSESTLGQVVDQMCYVENNSETASGCSEYGHLAASPVDTGGEMAYVSSVLHTSTHRPGHH